MSPALLTKMSILPNAWSVASTIVAAERLSTRSPWTWMALRPCRRMASQVPAAGRVLPWQATSAPESANARAMAAPMPVAAPVTRATLPSTRNRSLISLAAGFEPRLHGAERGLDVDHAELPVDPFALGGHHPHEVDRVTRTRDVRVVAAGHDHHVAIGHHTHELGRFAVRVDELHPVGGRRHVEEGV